MYDTSRTTEQILAMLCATPTHLAELIVGLPPDQLLAPPGPGEWSARDVLAHLRACSDVWGGYIRQILKEEQPISRAVNPATWIKQTDYREQPFEPSLQAFAVQRSDLLAVLSPLAPADWARVATVTGAGRPRERSVYTYALWLANHERSHLRQIDHIARTVRGGHPWGPGHGEPKALIRGDARR